MARARTKRRGTDQEDNKAFGLAVVHWVAPDASARTLAPYLQLHFDRGWLARLKMGGLIVGMDSDIPAKLATRKDA